MKKDALYNLENQPPLNSLELHLKEKGYIWYATCLTTGPMQVQAQIATCASNAEFRPGQEVVMTQNQWVTRFWMRTQSIAVARGDSVPVDHDGPALPLVRRSSVPPPLPKTLAPEASRSGQHTSALTVPSLFPGAAESGETFTSAKETIPSAPPEQEEEIRSAITLPAPSERQTTPDATLESGWHEPGSIPPPAPALMRPPPIDEASVSEIEAALDTVTDTSEISEALPSSPAMDVQDTEIVPESKKG